MMVILLYRAPLTFSLFSPQIDVFLNFITGSVNQDNNTVEWGFMDIR